MVAQEQNISSLDLASFVSSKLCHDLVSPVTALCNGFEVLDMNPDAKTKEMALDLIRRSIENSSARLQFFRMSLGSMGGPGGVLSTVEAHRIVEQLFQHEKPDLEWRLEPANVDKNLVRITLNLIMIALSSIPRGGKIIVANEENGTLSITAKGERASLNADTVALLTGTSPPELSSQVILPVLCARLAAEGNAVITAAMIGNEAIFAVSPRAPSL